MDTDEALLAEPPAATVPDRPLSAGPSPGGLWQRLQSRWWWSLVAIALVLLIASPSFANAYWMRILTLMLMYGAFAQALNVLVGLAGYPALGNIVFFGIGAYSAAILTEHHILSPVLALPAAAVLAALYALLVSRAMLGLRGAYFLMATVALNALTEQVVLVLAITEGARGMVVAPLVSGDQNRIDAFFLYIFLGIVILGSVLLQLIRRSRLGFGLLAIRGNENAAAALGVPTFRYKTIAWMISAALTGLVGATYAFWLGFIDPGGVFALSLSLTVILMVLLGGRWLVLGPVIGAGLYEYLEVVAWSKSTELHEGVLGVAIILLVMFLPGGLSEVTQLGGWVRHLLGRGRNVGSREAEVRHVV